MERVAIMTDIPFSPDDVEKVTRAVDKRAAIDFLNRVSNAVGMIYEPIHVTRMAKAKVAKAELYRRAEYRKQEEDARHQKIMEDISLKAIPDINDDADPASISSDWMANVFDKCRNVSDDDMQSLWARVLAGEANSPGSYSTRTVNFLSDFDKNDADLFTRLCGFGWTIIDFVPVIFDDRNAIYNRYGLDFDTLSHLEDIGLINFNSLSSYARGPRIFETLNVNYYGRTLILNKPVNKPKKIIYGTVRFTKVGAELAPICGSSPVDGFWEYVIQKWKEYSPKEV